MSLAMRVSRVGPFMAERLKSRSAISDVGEYIEQVLCRSCEPVKPYHRQCVAIAVNCGRSLFAPLTLFFEYFGGTCRDKLGNLSIKRPSVLTLA
jgi:hypothetical protein